MEGNYLLYLDEWNFGFLNRTRWFRWIFQIFKILKFPELSWYFDITEFSDVSVPIFFYFSTWSFFWHFGTHIRKKSRMLKFFLRFWYGTTAECRNRRNKIEKIGCEIAINRFSLHYSRKRNNRKQPRNKIGSENLFFCYWYRNQPIFPVFRLWTLSIIQPNRWFQK